MSTAAAKSTTTHVSKSLEYADEPDWKAWLAKYRVGAGNVFPQKVPYYLLLVGGPERIPFEFGQFLSLEYAVGLLHFDTVDGYRQYVDSLIAYETGGAPPRRKEAVFFRTQEKFDLATKLSALNLVQPLADGSPGLSDDMDKPVAETRGFTTSSRVGRRRHPAGAGRDLRSTRWQRSGCFSLLRLSRPGLSPTYA